mmetsp:Transcript_12302/g.22264  ORF Transcript_12302/g.22264 Transcript_12302/m.22264 type:complete len:182 (-) Transcript_12302:340-885(-)
MLRTTSSTMAKFARRLPPTITSSTSPTTPSTAIRGMTIISKDSASDFKKENYTSRMAATRRPVSPHVTIYSFPVAALTSIANRVTGTALSFGAAGLGVVELVGGNGAALDLMSSIGSGGGALVVAGAKFSVAFPVVYHYLGGCRHLIWDNSPEMLTNLGVEKTSYILVGSSLAISGVAMFV